MSDISKATLGHSANENEPFTPPATPGKPAVTMGPVGLNSPRATFAETTNKDETASTLPPSPEFATFNHPKHLSALGVASTNQGFMTSFDFDLWNEPMAYWRAQPPGAMEAYYLEHHGSKEPPYSDKGSETDVEVDTDLDYEMSSYSDDAQSWTPDEDKEWFMSMYESEERDCNRDAWLLQTFGSKEPWIWNEETPKIEDQL